MQRFQALINPFVRALGFQGGRSAICQFTKVLGPQTIWTAPDDTLVHHVFTSGVQAPVSAGYRAEMKMILVQGRGSFLQARSSAWQRVVLKLSIDPKS